MSDYFWPTPASASESWTYYCRVFLSLWVGLLGSMGGKKLLSQILTISRQSSSSYDLKFGR